jgi:hypothetical protein
MFAVCRFVHYELDLAPDQPGQEGAGQQLGAGGMVVPQYLMVRWLVEFCTPVLAAVCVFQSRKCIAAAASAALGRRGGVTVPHGALRWSF